ncbi:hypothetical protein ET33_28460 [Paenibacillus tyrfis]|uniref:Uncharacterized protein n=2 Tax=Paenibacillus tyrfis TaxID=1501230 RepID=A0A081NU80_9BACL|nr:hypothetical protein ET33_28460 [Paenibacillus tyrfis]
MNNINIKEISLAIKWAHENDQQILSVMSLSLIGLRLTEIVNLRWNQIDIPQKKFPFKENLNGGKFLYPDQC